MLIVHSVKKQVNIMLNVNRNPKDYSRNGEKGRGCYVIG